MATSVANFSELKTAIEDSTTTEIVVTADIMSTHQSSFYQTLTELISKKITQQNY